MTVGPHQGVGREVKGGHRAGDVSPGGSGRPRTDGLGRSTGVGVGPAKQGWQRGPTAARGSGVPNACPQKDAEGLLTVQDRKGISGGPTRVNTTSCPSIAGVPGRHDTRTHNPEAEARSLPPPPRQAPLGFPAYPSPPLLPPHPAPSTSTFPQLNSPPTEPICLLQDWHPSLP